MCATIGRSAAQDPPAAFYEYSPSRHGEYPRSMLAGWSGVMQADAFSGYNDLYAEARKPAPIVEAACWAHGRREFFELAKLAKAPIATRSCAASTNCSPSSATSTASRPTSDAQPCGRNAPSPWSSRSKRTCVSSTSGSRRRTTSPRQSATCSVRWGSFARFLDDGRICFRNNAAERALRGVAVGRRNWTFAGSDEGGRRAAAVYYTGHDLQTQ